MRERIVYPFHQILSEDVNSITDYVTENFRIITDGIIGASTGVVNGLNATQYPSTGAALTVTSGAVCDGYGNFYELMDDTIHTISGGAGTYKVYVTQGSATDSPLSGFVLTDTETMQEDFQTVNSRRYDSLTVSSTLSSVPANSHHIANAVFNGSAITSVTDVRYYLTIAALPAYSLQNWSNTGLDYAYRANKITGNIIDETTPSSVIWNKVDIDNSHAGQGFFVNNGTNPLAVSYFSYIRGNFGFNAFLASGGTGINISTADHTGAGIALYNLNRGLISSGNTIGNFTYVDTSTTGIILQGSTNNTGYGLIINNIGSDVSRAIQINNFNQQIASVASEINISGNVLLNFAQTINISGGGIGNLITHTAGSVQSICLALDNTSSSNSDVGVVVGFNSSTNFATGLQIASSNSGIVIDLSSAQTGIHINGNGTNDVGQRIYNSTTGIIIKESANPIKIENLSANITAIQANIFTGGTGMRVLMQDGTTAFNCDINLSTGSTPIYGLKGQQIGSRTFFNFVRGTNYATGVCLINDDATTGIKIHGTNTNDIGIDITNCETSLSITNKNTNNGVLIDIDGKDNTSASSDGIQITNVNRGIDLNNGVRGIVLNTGLDWPLRIVPVATPFTSGTLAGDIAVQDTGAAIKLQIWNSYAAGGAGAWEDCN